jgi:hypothetical protein
MKFGLSLRNLLKTYIIVLGVCGSLVELGGFVLMDVRTMIAGIYLELWILIILASLLINLKEKEAKLT